MYRPFTREWLYFSRRLNEMVYQMPQIFPHADAENRLICVTGVGAQVLLGADGRGNSRFKHTGSRSPMLPPPPIRKAEQRRQPVQAAIRCNRCPRLHPPRRHYRRRASQIPLRLRRHRLQARHLPLHLRPAPRPILPPPLRQQPLQRAAAHPARRRPRPLHRPRRCRARVRRSTRRLRPR